MKFKKFILSLKEIDMDLDRNPIRYRGFKTYMINHDEELEVLGTNLFYKNIFEYLKGYLEDMKYACIYDSDGGWKDIENKSEDYNG